jgi:hypothetical protein
MSKEKTCQWRRPRPEEAKRGRRRKWRKENGYVR